MIFPLGAAASDLRLATFHAELTRKGPGLLLRDILKGDDPQLQALGQIKSSVQPDILFLTKVDYDAGLRTAEALRVHLGFAYAFALPPNSMMPTPRDLDGDGRAGDRLVWARYAGEGAMLLLSNLPLELRFHLNDMIWQDASLETGMKLVGQGLWVVEVSGGDAKPLTLVLFQNQTPIFDGSEDRNGRRNAAQLRLLREIMNGVHGDFPSSRFVLMGNSNLDPEAGEGDRAAMAALLADPQLQDPRPQSDAGGRATAIWERPGPMRVSYILPSRDLYLQGGGVFWPATGPLREVAEQASRHRLVWVDIMQ